MNYSEIDEFTKEFKKLRKKYPSLDEDFRNVKEIIRCYPKGRGEKHWNLLKKKESVFVYKIRVRCRSLRSTEIRIIYQFVEIVNKVNFIEIYYKGDKSNEDRKRYERIFNESI